MRYELHLGDCLEVLRGMPANSVDSVVTDPPYGLTSARPGGRSAATEGAVMKGFMGLEWDGDVPSVDVWAECFRVLKPGGHLLSFGAARTYHHMAIGIEMAGFEIRDQIMWVFGSGFPKSHNLKGDHEGWGTALKPAHEPICMARKPMIGTVLCNVLEFGTGAINIDACRVSPTGESQERIGEASQAQRYTGKGGTNFAATPGIRGGDPSGRWPANLIHDGSPEVIAAFPDAPGQAGPSSDNQRSRGVCYGALSHGEKQYTPREDSGSAARFFYCAKTSRIDRHEGLENPGPQFKQGNTLRKVETTDTKGNNHPTVKPTELMAYLLRLVTPAGGRALDPFMGSGSTGKAAVLEGFDFVGIERDSAYMAIAKARIAYAQEQSVLQQQEQHLQEQQLSLFSA